MEKMDSALPRYVVLQSGSNGKYLSCGKDGSLKCNGEDATSAKCKFLIHGAAGYGREYFYMRSAYNNKYVGRADGDGGGYAYYVAESSDLGELFCSKPIDGDPFVIEIGTGQCFVNLSMDLCLVVGGFVTDGLFQVIDRESLVVLPKTIAFKGCNNMYLGHDGTHRPGHPLYLTFAHSDIGDPGVAMEIISNGNGSVCIRQQSNHTSAGDWWMLVRDGDCVARTILGDNYEGRATFFPVKVGDNSIALRCLDMTNQFLRYSPESNNCLQLDVASITREATFTVEEVILSRSIYDVRFRINDARIYDEEINAVATAKVENYSPTQSDTLVLKKKYTKTTTRTWDASVSLKLGCSASVKAGIPLIGEAGITVSMEVEGSYSWGETCDESEELETDFTVSVPPMTKVTASLVATIGKCDVPFSYTHQDHLHNGDSPCYDKDDGVFRGVNCYNFHYVHTEEKLTSPQSSLSSPATPT